MARANEAYRKAEALELAVMRVGTIVEAHSKSCDTFREALGKQEKDRREDLTDWRSTLGKRLDRQDKLLWSAIVSALLGLIGFLGELVVAGKIHI